MLTDIVVGATVAALLLPPILVAGPMAIAGLLLALSHALPARMPDMIATLVALAVAVCCCIMADAAAQGPLVYWFGGWVPRHGVALGIGFRVDQAGAALAGFAGLLVAATFVFAWGFFESVHAHFHVLMLLFLAAMVGFCLTHDLFDLFVWFEVMSVAAFALTGYRLKASALEGALNFTVVNTLGSHLMLAGIGLLYARAGALDFSALGHAFGGRGPDPVADAAFAMIATALLIKAAMVPFHFWLADAHAVAPSPVSVIFSGIMVPLGLFGLPRPTWTVFAGVADVTEFVRGVLSAAGAGARFALNAAAAFMHGKAAGTPPTGSPHPFLPWPGTGLGWAGLGVLVAGFDLSRHRLPRVAAAVNDRLTGPPLRLLQAAHSGLAGDYVTWIVLGLALFAVAFVSG